MISTNKPGFEYASISEDRKYFKIVNDICYATNGYQTFKDKKQSELFQCFQMLFETIQVKNVLSKKSAVDFRKLFGKCLFEMSNCVFCS